MPGTFTMEWPRGSGNVREFPEIDRAEWFPLDVAGERILLAQRTFLDRLRRLLTRGKLAPARPRRPLGRPRRTAPRGGRVLGV